MNIINNPVILHINYFEQGQSLEYICRRAVSLGCDGIEFRRSRDIDDETPERYLDALKNYSEAYGLRYLLFGGPGINVMTDDKNIRRSEIDGYKRFLELADKRLKLTVINFMTGWLSKPGAKSWEYETYGSFCAEERHWAYAVSACREIADFAPHVKFAFETHMGYLHDLSGSAKKLCDMIDRKNFGINLDYGNTVYFAPSVILPLEESIDECGDRLFYTHMKNSVPGSPRRAPTSLSGGDINHRAYIRKLRSTGFDGFIGIEAPRPGDREWFAAEDLAYLKSIIADCADTQ
ncbi:MAG: sugar phosphate isomerase/epimerase [Eubacteriales bacterium]|nr:sugar phosphate isomerase/epimerase [Eubacteriales bacterium]